MGKAGMMLAVAGGLCCCAVVVSAGILILKSDDQQVGSGINPNLTTGSTNTDKYVSGTQADGKTVYACQADFDGSVKGLLGKTWDGYNRCDVSWGGKVNNVNKYVIPKPLKPYKWVKKPALESSTSMGTLVAGVPSYAPDGVPFTSRVCRADIGGGYMHIGRTYSYTDAQKLNPGNSNLQTKCWVTGNKQEIPIDPFEYAVFTS